MGKLQNHDCNSLRAAAVNNDVNNAVSILSVYHDLFIGAGITDADDAVTLAVAVQHHKEALTSHVRRDPHRVRNTGPFLDQLGLSIRLAEVKPPQGISKPISKVDDWT